MTAPAMPTPAPGTGAGRRPALPDHGTESRYKGTRTRPGCRCTTCIRGNRKASVQRELARLAGQPASLTPDEAAALIAHIRALRDSGMSQCLIARQADVAQATISYLLRGKTKTCHRSKAARILAVQPRQFDNISEQPALGYQRRVQALFVMGHSRATIAAAAGLHSDTIGAIANGRFRTLDGRIAAAVRTAYDALRAVPGRNPYTRARARKDGWHGPLAWHDIDDPNATPEPDTCRDIKPGSNAEAALVAEEIAFLASFGLSYAEIARRVGRTEKYVREQLAGRRGPGWREAERQQTAAQDGEAA